ncbi:phosphatidate cytidylyltransferase, mitochondrial-like isoform X1 [Papaver somniferum]|uniref:phosphatidate cytidylyltransferase, mitochondrial-like isoform X1 n=1 Tax=Papaver somniferum TaxID=3469 RepID=UPI000E6F58C8|nr:phosphatidate cytidylyltransferase, mitochondrial-like isoform X1 [Papaver somniferum]
MEKKNELGGLLDILPPVDFCCSYGSSLLPNNNDKGSMVDYMIGVSDPLQWHNQNLKMNRNHYASWMMQFGGPKVITGVAESIGVGVHFNPYVTWEDRMVKYGVIRMHNLVQDLLNWESFYLSGRLQKPVHILADSIDIENLNLNNLRAATSTALLLLPSEFSEEDLYAKICSLSYMGDLRMFFAEDKNKVKRIVQGQFDLFQKSYKPFIDEYAAKDLLRFSSSSDPKVQIAQDCALPATRSLVSSLPSSVRSGMGMRLGDEVKVSESGRVIREVVIGSREETVECLRKVLRRKVMVSSARQAFAGLLSAGAVNSAQYLTRKMGKALKSWM